MRFFIVFITICTGSISLAKVNDFNGLVKETSQQEKRLHKKLLQAIQNTQVSIAYNDKLDKLQSEKAPEDAAISVRLVRAAE